MEYRIKEEFLGYSLSKNKSTIKFIDMNDEQKEELYKSYKHYFYEQESEVEVDDNISEIEIEVEVNNIKKNTKRNKKK